MAFGKQGIAYSKRAETSLSSFSWISISKPLTPSRAHREMLRAVISMTGVCHEETYTPLSTEMVRARLQFHHSEQIRRNGRIVRNYHLFFRNRRREGIQTDGTVILYNHNGTYSISLVHWPLRW